MLLPWFLSYLHTIANNHKKLIIIFCQIFYVIIWAKFWEEKREYGIEIKGNALIQIPGERTISVSDNNIQLQKLKEYIDAITDEIVYTLLSFEVERDGIHRLVDDFTKRIYLIERDIRRNKGLKGRCGWERNFWGR
jgi:hypothetical protein